MLDLLPEEQFDLLVEWLSIEGLTYEQTSDKLAEEYGVEASVGMLWSFYQKHCIGYKHKKARKLAEQVGEMYREETNFSELTIKSVEQRAFELSMCRDASIKELGELAKMIGDSQRLALQQRKLDLDVDKWRAAAKDDIEKGLDALLGEIKGNKAALELFKKMKAIVLKSVEVTPG